MCFGPFKRSYSKFYFLCSSICLGLFIKYVFVLRNLLAAYTNSAACSSPSPVASPIVRRMRMLKTEQRLVAFVPKHLLLDSIIAKINNSSFIYKNVETIISNYSVLPALFIIQLVSSRSYYDKIKINVFNSQFISDNFYLMITLTNE